MDVRLTTLRRPSGRSRTLIGLSAGALVAVGIAGGFVGGQAASASPTSPPPYANVVTLQTGTSNVVTSYGSTAGTVVGTQTLSSKSNDCTLKSSSPALIVFSGLNSTTARAAGLRAGSIGVVDNTSGESCGQVNAPGETLVLDLPNPMSGAVLDVEVQKDAVITATLSYDGGNVVTRTLRSGQAAVNAPGAFFSCRPGSTSSAPNSGPSDNCRWVINSALFNKMTLTAEQGQFSLEGGSDGAVPVNPIASNPQEPTGSGWPTTMTYFTKASGIDCTTPIQLTGTGTTPTVTIKRVTDLDGTCKLIPYSLTGAGGSFTFNKPVGDMYAQFYIDVAWKAAVGQPIKKTTVDYLQGGGEVVLDYCPQVIFDANGGALTTAQAGALPDQDLSTADPAKEFACVMASATSLPSGGIITVTQKIYLLGDPIMRG